MNNQLNYVSKNREGLVNISEILGVKRRPIIQNIYDKKKAMVVDDTSHSHENVSQTSNDFVAVLDKNLIDIDSSSLNINAGYFNNGHETQSQHNPTQFSTLQQRVENDERSHESTSNIKNDIQNELSSPYIQYNQKSKREVGGKDIASAIKIINDNEQS